MKTNQKLNPYNELEGKKAHEGARLIVIAFEIEKVIIPSLKRTVSRMN